MTTSQNGITTPEIKNPETQAYLEVIKEVKAKANHHHATASAFRNMIKSPNNMPESILQMLNKHETMARVQFQIADAIEQMNRDNLCDKSPVKIK